MERRAILALGLVAVTGGLVWSAPCLAQTPPIPLSCSSPAVSGEQLQTDADGKVQNSAGKGDGNRKVIVDRIEFDRPVHLPESDVEQIIKTANERESDADSSAWIDELAEIGLRGAWQNQGYFQINLTAHAQSIGGDSDHERFLVTVHVEKEGPQFHLGELQFAGEPSIPEAELRQVFPMRGGEIFSVEQVRAGIEALTKLYVSHGYIDFTVVPDIEVDENLQRISLVMHLDEQKQFRLGSFEVRGLDPSLEARLRSILVPGQIFNEEHIVALFKENQLVLPPLSADHWQIRRNVRTGIADLTFDPRSCPRLGTN